MTSLLNFEPYVDSCSNLFFERLDESFVKQSRSCDLGTWLQLYAMDVIAEVTFGKRFGCLEQGGDVGNLIATIEKFLFYASWVGQIPWMHKYLLGNPALPYVFPSVEKINHVVNVCYLLPLTFRYQITD